MFSCLFSKKSKSESEKSQSASVPDNYYYTHLPLKVYQYLIACDIIDVNDADKTESKGTTFPLNRGNDNAFVRVTVEKGSRKVGMISVRVYLQVPPKYIPNRFNFSEGQWYSTECKNSKNVNVSKGRADTGACHIYDDKEAAARTDKEVEFLLKFLKQNHVTPENKPLKRPQLIPI